MTKKIIPIVLGVFLVLIIIIGIVTFFLLGIGQSFISVQNIPEQSVSYSFDGISGVAKSPLFGAIISVSGSAIFWGSNSNDDGDISISNSIMDGNSLILKSHISSATQNIGGVTNYIKTSLNLSNGTLIAECFIVGTLGTGHGKTECMVDGNKFISGSFEVIIESPRTVDVYVYASGDNEISEGPIAATTKLTLNFVENGSIIGNGTVVNSPLSPSPSGWDAFKNLILNLIQSLAQLLTGQTIVGATSVAPGSTQTYNIDLSVPVPDSDFSDGYYEIQYANWILSDEDGNSLQEGAWVEVKGSYIKDATITVPNVQNKNYVIASIITQINGTYDYGSETWSFSEEVPIIQEGIDVKTKNSINPPISPGPGGFSKFIQAIKNLFCKILPFLCSS